MRTFIVLNVFSLILSSTTALQAGYVTVSLASVANDFQYRLVDPPVGLVTLGDVPFDIPASGNNAWSGHIGTTIGVQSTTAMVLPMSVYGATAVDTLINLGWGVLGSDKLTATFIGTGGANYSVNLITGTDVRSWLDTPFCCNTINGTTTIEVWQGIGSQYPSPARIDKQRIALPPIFATETLTQFILVDNGVTGDVTNTIYDNSEAQRALLYGVTVVTVPEPGSCLLVFVAVGMLLVRRRVPHI